MTIEERLNIYVFNKIKSYNLDKVHKRMKSVVDFPSSVSRKSLYKAMAQSGFNKFQADKFSYGSISAMKDVIDKLEIID